MAESKNTTRTKFTAARVAEFACPPDKREAWLWDTATPGLALRAQGDRVAWVWQRKLHGRAVRVTIGARESWPLESVWTGRGAERAEIQRGAREEARRLSGLADSGIDPRNERAAVVAATEAERLERARAVVTLGDVWAAYAAARADEWSDGYKRDHEQAMAAPGRTVGRRKRKSKGGPLYPLHAERLEALTPARLERWLEDERKTRPAFAARAFRLLRACLRWAEGRPEYAGLAEPARVLSRDVRRKVPKVGTRDDCLQREQLPAWFAAVRAIADPVKAAYLQGLLLTGARREELAGLRWADCDFQWGALTIRDKLEGLRVIPLPPHLAGLLAALPRRTLANGDPNPWVFSSATTKHGRMPEANSEHTRAVAAAGLPHLTLHGLRRSFGTLSEWTETPVGVVAQIMGHKPSAIAEKHYRRRPLDLLRQWHTKLETWILTEAGLLNPEPVTQNPQNAQNPEAQAQGPRLVVVNGGGE